MLVAVCVGAWVLHRESSKRLGVARLTLLSPFNKAWVGLSVPPGLHAWSQLLTLQPSQRERFNFKVASSQKRDDYQKVNREHNSVHVEEPTHVHTQEIPAFATQT